jgi:hypothetical protein
MLYGAKAQVTGATRFGAMGRNASGMQLCSGVDSASAPETRPLSLAADASLWFGRAAVAVSETPRRCSSRAAVRARLATIEAELGADGAESVSTYYLWETAELLRASCVRLVAVAQAETVAAIRVVLEVFNLRCRLRALAALLAALRAAVATTARPAVPQPPRAAPEPARLLLRSLTVAPLAP